MMLNIAAKESSFWTVEVRFVETEAFLFLQWKQVINLIVRILILLANVNKKVKVIGIPAKNAQKKYWLYVEHSEL